MKPRNLIKVTIKKYANPLHSLYLPNSRDIFKVLCQEDMENMPTFFYNKGETIVFIKVLYLLTNKIELDKVYFF